MDEYDDEETVNALQNGSQPASHATLDICGKPVRMELDTGSAHTVVNDKIWHEIGAPVLSSAPKLTAYGGFQLPIKGSAEVSARFQGEEKKLELIVVNNNSPSLLGRKWMKAFSPLREWFDNAPISSINVSLSSVDSLCNEYSELFAPGLGKVKGYQAHIYIKPDAHFRFFKARAVSFALKPKIEADLLRLQGLGVIEPVKTAEFGATPIVPVPKPNGTIRICGDFKVTVNKYADMQRYPLPHPEELRAALTRNRIFSKADLADA